MSAHVLILFVFFNLKINKYEIELGKKEEENQFKHFIASQKNFKKVVF